jgi:hypothetical protein
MSRGAAVVIALFVCACAEDIALPNGFVRADAGTREAAPYEAGPPQPFDAGQGTGKPPQDAECDLRGRWLIAQRVLATAIGQEQAAHNWFYYELRHEEADVLVLKGLHCGYQVIKKTALSAAVDSSGAWPGLLKNNSSAGRKGQYVKQGSECKLTLDKEYVVRGATVGSVAAT